MNHWVHDRTVVLLQPRKSCKLARPLPMSHSKSTTSTPRVTRAGTYQHSPVTEPEGSAAGSPAVAVRSKKTPSGPAKPPCEDLACEAVIRAQARTRSFPSRHSCRAVNCTWEDLGPRASPTMITGLGGLDGRRETQGQRWRVLEGSRAPVRQLRGVAARGVSGPGAELAPVLGR